MYLIILFIDFVIFPPKQTPVFFYYSWFSCEEYEFLSYIILWLQILKSSGSSNSFLSLNFRQFGRSVILLAIILSAGTLSRTTESLNLYWSKFRLKHPLCWSRKWYTLGFLKYFAKFLRKTHLMEYRFDKVTGWTPLQMFPIELCEDF